MASNNLSVLEALDTARTQWYHAKAIVIAGMGFFTDAYDLFFMFDAIKKRLLSTSFNRMEELIGIPCKHVMAEIYNVFENSIRVGIPELWVIVAYKLETWSHVYSFKINPCNGREMWPLVESTTVIIPPNYKPQVGRPVKKTKKSYDEIASESHNRKSYRGQRGASQAGGSSKAYARQAVGARNVSGQAVGAINASSQAGVSSQPSAPASTATGARNFPSQAVTFHIF
nr:transposase, mutator type [Tanacetum cinerariifolium]